MSRAEMRTQTLTQRERELAAIISAYNEVTEKLKVSHERLQQEVRRLREELAEKKRELARRERLAALGEMAAGLAHEIRNPLGGVQLYASLLEQEVADRAEAVALVQKIRAGVAALDRLVSDVLAFAAQTEPELAPTNLGKLVGRVLELLQPHVSTCAAEIVVDDALCDVWVMADATLLSRALMNLVTNAIEAVGSEGTVWISASQASRNANETEATPERGRVVVTVADDGPGVPEELRDRIFNPFFTTKATGTGLGLAIVYRIVEAHGGSIRVGPREGGGAVFQLWLPAADPPAQR